MVATPATRVLPSAVRKAEKSAPPVFIPNDHLGDHRVVIDRDRISRAHAGVNTNLRLLSGKVQARDAAGLRQKIARRVLRVEARLDRVSQRSYFLLAQRQRAARGNLHLPFDEIDAGDHFGHRMFDLEPRIHFEKIEGAFIGR